MASSCSFRRLMKVKCKVMSISCCGRLIVIVVSVVVVVGHLPKPRETKIFSRPGRCALYPSVKVKACCCRARQESLFHIAHLPVEVVVAASISSSTFNEYSRQSSQSHIHCQCIRHDTTRHTNHGDAHRPINESKYFKFVWYSCVFVCSCVIRSSEIMGTVPSCTIYIASIERTETNLPKYSRRVRKTSIWCNTNPAVPHTQSESETQKQTEHDKETGQSIKNGYFAVDEQQHVTEWQKAIDRQPNVRNERQMLSAVRR